MLALMGGMRVTMVDFAINCLDEDVRNALTTQAHVLSFIKADLCKHIPCGAKYGYCCDVLEHIEQKYVWAAVKNILKAAQHCFFQISTIDDLFGKHIGESLHLTVKPYSWWLSLFKEHECVIHWSQELDNAALFYVSAWNPASELTSRGSVNTEDATILTNIYENIRRPVNHVGPFDRQERPVLLLAGGPSLNDYEDDIREKRDDGYALVTTNGAYSWAIERGILPSAQIVVDAREFNSRFLSPVISDCKYLLASQCHPMAFEAVPSEQTWLWHAALSDEALGILDEYYGSINRQWFPSPGGSTVMLRAFPLLRMLGFHQFEVYGFDSCIMNEQHHAYPQDENSNDGIEERRLLVSCGGDVFKTTAWQASQAQEFIDLMRMMGEELDLIVHGNGLIANIIKSAAALDDIVLQPTTT